MRLLAYKPKCFLWAGADLFHVTNINGNRQMVVVETNSCPSGQKSMPLLDEAQELGGYKYLLENAFARLLRKEGPPECKEGVLAVLYDKNYMEASGRLGAWAPCRLRIHRPPHPTPPTRHPTRLRLRHGRADPGAGVPGRVLCGRP